MGRPNLPFAVHQHTGATKKNKARFEDREEPETQGPIGDPPAEWIEKAQGQYGAKWKFLVELWRKLVAQAPVGVLTASDSECLANICRMGYDASLDGRGARQARKDYARELRAIGCTPEGRAIRGMGGKAGGKSAVNPLDAYRRKQSA